MTLPPTEPIISIVTAAIKARLESKTRHTVIPVGFSRKATPRAKAQDSKLFSDFPSISA